MHKSLYRRLFEKSKLFWEKDTFLDESKDFIIHKSFTRSDSTGKVIPTYAVSWRIYISGSNLCLDGFDDCDLDFMNLRATSDENEIEATSLSEFCLKLSISRRFTRKDVVFSYSITSKHESDAIMKALT